MVRTLSLIGLLVAMQSGMTGASASDREVQILAKKLVGKWVLDEPATRRCETLAADLDEEQASGLALVACEFKPDGQHLQKFQISEKFKRLLGPSRPNYQVTTDASGRIWLAHSRKWRPLSVLESDCLQLETSDKKPVVTSIRIVNDDQIVVGHRTMVRAR